MFSAVQSLDKINDTGTLRCLGIRLAGSFQSRLVADNQRAVWVMKSAPHSIDKYALINEVLGWQFCRLLTIPFPPYKLAEITVAVSIEAGAGGFEIGENARFRPNAYFLSRYAPDLENAIWYDRLPSVWLNEVVNTDECLGMFLFDVWADHQDRRQALFSRTERGLKATFIDNTHLFRGPDRKACRYPRRLSAAEIVALSTVKQSDRVHHWIELMRRILPPALDRSLDFLPVEWRKAQADDTAFKSRYMRRLADLDRLVEVAIDSASSCQPAFRDRIVCLLPEEEAPATIPLV